VALLYLAKAGQLVHFGLGAGIVARRHRQPVCQQVGYAKDQDDLGRQARTNDTSHDGEGGDRPVNAAIHPVAQVIRGVVRKQALPDRFAGMVVFKLHGHGAPGHMPEWIARQPNPAQAAPVCAVSNSDIVNLNRNVQNWSIAEIRAQT
jgi:hypothetical protein